MRDFLLIGLDGGASKVQGLALHLTGQSDFAVLAGTEVSCTYTEHPDHLSNFVPLPLTQQRAWRRGAPVCAPALTQEEIRQGAVVVDCARQVVLEIVRREGIPRVLLGVGMPGLKTSDGRGIEVLRNGPRIPTYSRCLEEALSRSGVSLIAPIHHLGSDADYCGLGERYAEGGAFRGVQNAYYLGGGTGLADAMMLKGKLVPFDQASSWIAKSWEMLAPDGQSFENHLAMPGLLHAYATGRRLLTRQAHPWTMSMEELIGNALAGEEAAQQVFRSTASLLAKLLSERILTLYQGAASGQYSRCSPLNSDHPFRGFLWDRLILGQRLAQLWNTTDLSPYFQEPTRAGLAWRLNQSEIPAPVRNAYLEADSPSFRLQSSLLRQAPAIGAGIDAYLQNRSPQPNGDSPKMGPMGPMGRDLRDKN